MALDRIALGLVIIVAIAYISVLMIGIIGLFPFGLPLLALFLVGAYLFLRVLRERLTNSEDDYYEKNIDK
ncbi:MAG: hypothetical protein L3J67_01860 [Hyphomicrobiaceae bacterium]|nr:hypothetical protein [Hyphomicrobiaceae bacterium]